MQNASRWRRSDFYFAVTREPGHGWDSSHPLREQAKWAEHAAFMDGLAHEGFVVLGGPVGGGPTTLLVVDAESEEEIAARLADDPWSPLGLLQVTKIDRWQILLARSDYD